MPNHVVTKMRVLGPDAEKIIHGLESIDSEDGQKIAIDFNKIIPMPITVYVGPLGSVEEEKYPDELNWYGWSIKNWGTKWNAYGQRYINKTTIKFETAWAFPMPVALKLSKAFPNNTFHFQYADEDIGRNLGDIKIKNGKIVSEKDFKEYSKQAKAFARRLQRIT